MTTIDRAFTLFQKSAQRLDFTAESLHEPTRLSRISQVNREGATLQLVWSGVTNTLRLEITHGPPDCSYTGWLCLFEAPCQGSLVGNEVTGLTLSSCIEEGFTLMSPIPVSSDSPPSGTK